MRTMYDSTTAADIPRNAAMVAGYIDGRYRWSDLDWAMFPDAVKVRIACFATTNDGDVLDVESGCSEPSQAPAWARRRRAAGIEPSIYVNRSNVDAVREAFMREGDPLPLFWLASYDNIAEIPPGYVAKQYANPDLTHFHFDLSVVADYWPGIDRPRVVTPELVGQSADLRVRVGEVALFQATYRFTIGGVARERTIGRKAWAHRPGRFIIAIYPPVDPDSDETLHADAEPALFVLDVTNQA